MEMLKYKTFSAIIFLTLFFGREKSFIIDKITEDTFYKNLLLGLPIFLKSNEFIKKVELNRQKPATFTEICSWEVENAFILPEDIRSFYQSTNGFSFTYNFHSGKRNLEKCIVGSIRINSLCNLSQITSLENSKIFALVALDDDNVVVLAQLNLNMSPNIWLYYQMKVLYFLSEDFTTYFRMSVAHLGVPGWQLMALKANVSEWGVEMLQILAPSVLEKPQSKDNDQLNFIDCSIFENEKDSKLPIENIQKNIGNSFVKEQI